MFNTFDGLDLSNNLKNKLSDSKAKTDFFFNLRLKFILNFCIFFYASLYIKKPLRQSNMQFLYLFSFCNMSDKKQFCNQGKDIKGEQHVFLRTG